MKKRFIYHDEKSNKFWWIDYEGDSLAVNYGKVGSIGKFQTKEFDNEEQCLKTRVLSVNHGLPTPVHHLWLPEELVKKEAGVAFGLIKNVMIRGQGGE